MAIVYGVTGEQNRETLVIASETLFEYRGALLPGAVDNDKTMSEIIPIGREDDLLTRRIQY